MFKTNKIKTNKNKQHTKIRKKDNNSISLPKIQTHTNKKIGKNTNTRKNKTKQEIKTSKNTKENSKENSI